MTMNVGHVSEVWRYPVKSMAGGLVDELLLDGYGVVGDRCWAMLNAATGDIAWGKAHPKLMNLEARYTGRHPPRRVYTSDVPAVEIRFPDGTTVSSSDNPDGRISDYVGAPLHLHPLEPPGNREHYRWRQPLDQEAIRKLLGIGPGESLPDMSVYDASLLEVLAEHFSPPGTYNDMSPLHLLTTASISHMEQVSGEVFDRRRFRPNFLVKTVPGVAGLAEFEWVGRLLQVGETLLRVDAKTVRCAMPTRPQAPFDLEQNPRIARSLYDTTGRFLGASLSVARGGRIAPGDAVTLVDAPG